MMIKQAEPENRAHIVNVNDLPGWRLDIRSGCTRRLSQDYSSRPDFDIVLYRLQVFSLLPSSHIRAMLFLKEGGRVNLLRPSEEIVLW